MSPHISSTGSRDTGFPPTVHVGGNPLHSFQPNKSPVAGNNVLQAVILGQFDQIFIGRIRIVRLDVLQDLIAMISVVLPNMGSPLLTLLRAGQLNIAIDNIGLFVGQRGDMLPLK